MRITDRNFDNAVEAARDSQLYRYLNKPEPEPETDYICYNCGHFGKAGEGEVENSDGEPICPKCQSEGFFCRGCGEFCDYDTTDDDHFCDGCGKSLTIIERMALES